MQFWAFDLNVSLGENQLGSSDNTSDGHFIDEGLQPYF